MNTDKEVRNDTAMFDAYVSLREIAQKYQLEDRLDIPRVVFAGETSTGKSMLVQNFLRFPCAFSQSDVGTRCPVSYRLRYNSALEDGVILIKEPAGIKGPEDLADHLQKVMQRIEQGPGFSLKEYVIHIESNQYRDFEILDVPGLISGSHNNEHAIAVEQITEHYVRDPKFLIVQLKEAIQLGVNSFGTKRIRSFCLDNPAPCGSPLPPRHDYENFTITIQTKFDSFMDRNKDGSDANKSMNELLKHFDQRTLFVSMIFDGYNFDKHTHNENSQYIANLPKLECERVDQWIDQQLVQQSNHKHVDFDKKRFRPLIGINIVRDSIQDMWAKAFRGAIPKIQQVLHELVQEQKIRYDTILRVAQETDLTTIRSTYQRYIEHFRSTLSNYVAYRAEISSQFEFDKYSRTYKQIEDEYNQWSRKYELTWCAHQTAEQLLNAPKERQIYSLPFRYIGARHFERIRQVFFYMILTYQPKNFAQEFFETAQSHIYGVTSDEENLGKGVRELLYVYIRETFCIGICWLTQIYSFLIDHFEQHVTSVLLSPDSEFAHLATSHTKFLHFIHLEYHKTTRQFIRRAVKSTKHARYAKMVYVSHSICYFLRTLVASFPPTIKNDQQNEDPVSDINPLRLIFDPDSSLPEKRNCETGNYLPATRNVINELYIALRGLLLQDITTNFFANIVTNLQQYDKIKISNALQYRIFQMSNKQIAQMFHIDLDKNLKELQIVYEKLKDLEQGYVNIEQASRLFDGKIISNSNGEKQETKNILNQKRDRDHREIMNKLRDIHINKNEDNNTESNSRNESNDNYNDEHELKILNTDPDISQQYLLELELFQRHDKEDLQCGFLEGDDFNINKHKILEKIQPLRPPPPPPSAPSRPAPPIPSAPPTPPPSLSSSVKNKNVATNPQLTQFASKDVSLANPVDISQLTKPSASNASVHIHPLDIPQNSPKSSHENIVTESVDDKKKKKH